MTAAFENQQQCLQVYSSSEDNCMVGTVTSHSCAKGTHLCLLGSPTKGMNQVSFLRAVVIVTSKIKVANILAGHPASLSPRDSAYSLTNWNTKHNPTLDSDESPSKHYVLSLETRDVDVANKEPKPSKLRSLNVYFCN